MLTAAEPCAFTKSMDRGRLSLDDGALGTRSYSSNVTSGLRADPRGGSWNDKSTGCTQLANKACFWCPDCEHCSLTVCGERGLCDCCVC